MEYSNYSREELENMLKEERKTLGKLGKRGLVIDMSRGRPAKEQLDIAMPMLENAGAYNYALASGDARNYGGLGDA